ncbi:MAG TPA: CHRD domain-containing protein [Myxococcota bacterium]|nr:CHRD domain-containing protein [Myxococcota bacterium]
MRNSLLRWVQCAFCAASVAAAGHALADTTSYGCELKSSQEVPPNDSNASGKVEAKLDSATLKFSWKVSDSGLSGQATAAHFHGPAKVGANAGPVITLAQPLTSPMTGEATLTKSQADELAGGLWYFNVHTAMHPSGEIRCQLAKM